MTYDTRALAFLTELAKLAERLGIRIVKEPEIADAGEPPKPKWYIPDNDRDYHG